MLIDKVKTYRSRVNASMPGRWLWLVIGAALIVNGIYLIHQRGSLDEATPLVKQWNNDYHLEIVNIQNLAEAIPYLLVGGLLSAFAFTPQWKKQEEIRIIARSTGTTKWVHLVPRLVTTTVLFAYLIYMLAQHKYSPFLFWLWIFILALQTLQFYRREKSVGVTLSPNITVVDMIWIAALFFGGLAIGAFALIDIPNIMVPDEGAFWETARAIATGELKAVFFGFGVYTFPVASSIFQGWVMRLVGIDLWGWRFASVLAGTFTVIPLYLLSREWFDRRVAVVAALLMLTNSYYLSFARMGYNNSQALFPVVLSLYFWSLGYKRASGFYYWLAGLAAGLGFYTYTAAWLGLVSIVIVMTLFFVIRRTKPVQALFAMAILVSAATATALPRFVYGASSKNPEPIFYKLVETSFVSNFYGSAYYSPDELYPEGDGYQLGTNKIFYAPDVYAKLLTRSTVRSLAALFEPFLVTEHFMTTNLSGGFLPAIGLTLGLSLSLRTIKQTRSILLLAWLGAGLFFLSIIAAFPPRHTHLVTIIPVLAVLSAIGFVASIDTIANELQKKWASALIPWAQLGLIVLVSGTSAFFGVKQYFTVMPVHNPPLFEDIASWIAWRNEEPLTIVYVGAREDLPHRVQYHVNTFMVPHKYISTTPALFNWKDVPPGSIVFYEQQEEGLPPPGDGFNTPATYTNQNKEVIGSAWTNTNVDLQPTLPFFSTNMKFPISGILLGSAMAIIVFALIALQIRVTAEKMAGEPVLHIHAEVSLRKPGKKVKEMRADKL